MHRVARSKHPGSTLTALVALLALAAAPLGFASEPPAVQEADRLFVRYRLGSFQVESMTPLRTVLPPGDALPGEPGARSGFWIELLSPSGELRYRRVIGDPVRLFFEGPGGGADLPRREETMAVSRLFALVLPRVANGDQLVLFGSPQLPGFQDQPAAELGRVTFQVESGRQP